MDVSPARINFRLLTIAFILIGTVSLGSWVTPRFKVAAKTDSAVIPVPFVDEHFIRQVPLLANDLVVDPITQTIYVSTPSSALQNGNSIVPLNPSTGAAGASVFIGSEPGKMAISDNGQSMYVLLSGAAAVRQFDIATQTAGSQVSFGHDSFSGPNFPRDIAVQPGNANTAAISRPTSASGGLAIYDGVTQRPTTVSFSDASIAFNTIDASRLYGLSSGTFRRMTVNASGVTLASTANVSANGDIRFDNGRLYASNGQVLDPETGTSLGQFVGPSFSITQFTPFTTDSTVNRAFYLTFSGAPETPHTTTVRVFDQQTFVPVGTIDIPNTLGAPKRIVRWGSNGLALCTTAGELYIIQSTLVSSADPIPTPTPTPTGTPTPTPTPPIEQAFTREVALRGNDIVYDPGTQKIFASVSSIAGAGGNSITPIDVNDATVGTSVFVGSEPNKLARSNNGQFLYVGLDGAAAVRRFDIASQTAGLQFPVGLGTFEGPFFVEDIEVSPGEPTVVAISRKIAPFSPSHEGVAIYDNGVQRTTTTPDHTGSNKIEYSANPGTLYGQNTASTEFGFRKMTVTGLGVTVTQTTSSVVPGSPGDFQFAAGRVYFNNGYVINPEGPTLVGFFKVNFGHIVEPDPSVGRVFFISTDSSDPSGSTVQIKAFDINTFVPVGSLSVQGVRGFVRTLIRWGTNGLAFSTSGGQVFLIQSSLVAPTSPAPTPTPTPTPTATPTPTPVPTPGAGELRTISLTTNDLVVGTNSQTIFASVPSSVGVTGNSLAPIDAAAGTVGATVFVGSEPNKLAISSQGETIYVGIDGANAVRKFDVATLTPGLQFSLGSDPFSGPFRADDMEVAPGQSGVLAVSLRGGGSPRHRGVAVFENGVQHQLTTPGHTGSNIIEFSNSPEVLYGQNIETTEFGFRRMAVAPCGVVTVRTVQNLMSGGFGGEFEYDNGTVYSTFGRVVDPEAASLLGTFVLRDPNSSQFGTTLVLPDAKAGRVYFVMEENGTTFFRVFDIKTFLKLGELRLPTVTGTLGSLVRWGTNGIAWRNTTGTVFLLQNSLIGVMDPAFTPAAVPPTPTATVTVNVSSFNGDPGGVTVNVTGATTTSGSTDSLGRLTLTELPICGSITITPSKPNYVFSPLSATVSNIANTQNVNFSATLKTVGFAQAATNVPEGATNISLLVTRVVSEGAATVKYETASGTASDRSDFNTTLGTLQFAHGESSKPINILLANDTLVEGPEAFTITLHDPTNAVLSPLSTFTVNLIDDDTIPGTLNPLNNVGFYVRQHYTDFLNRIPDNGGLVFWSNEITSCGTNTQCREVKRVNVSAAFFLSIEFQETGYLVYRIYKTGFGNLPGAPVPVRFTDFLRDSQQMGFNIQVGVGNWQAQLEANKQAFALAFVQRPDFQTAFPNSLTAAQFVDQLNANVGGVLSSAERSTLIAMLTTPSDVTQRAAVLRAVAEDQDLRNAELNKAFVLMQYFGYLRRNPNDAPDTNFDGWQFWLDKLNQFNGNFVQAEMVKAFLLSLEYQQRFGATNFQLSQ